MNAIRFPIAAKILSIIVSLLLLMALVGFSAHRRIGQVRNEVHDLATFIIPITDVVAVVSVHALEQEVLFEQIRKLNQTAPHDKTLIDQVRKRFEELNPQIDTELVRAVDLVDTAVAAGLEIADRGQLAAVRPLLNRIEQQHQRFHDRANAAFDQMANDASEPFTDALEHELDQAEQDLEAEIDQHDGPSRYWLKGPWQSNEMGDMTGLVFSCTEFSSCVEVSRVSSAGQKLLRSQ